MDGAPWPRLFSAPFLHERQGIDLTSGACDTRVVRRYRFLTPKAPRVLVLAAPMHSFRMQIMPLEAKLSRQQVMTVLRARELIQDDMAVDLLVAPDDQNTIAVFTLPLSQCEAWQASYRSSTTHIAALEPDSHALWRYAKQQRSTQHGWLIAMPRQSTLYWPAPWPWGYHAEPLHEPLGAGEEPHHALHTALRRASLMTSNDAPYHLPLMLAGDEQSCRNWLAFAEDVHWQCCKGPHPVAAGAALKTRGRWA